jgi:nucleotide-binding universal stress UspA family protein
MSNLTVLIPLDGSKQAEQALTFLIAFKSLRNLSVRLLTVAESDNSVPPSEETRREEAAKAYLEDVTSRAKASFDSPIECILRTGRAHQQILEEAERDDVNLLLLTTHGRTITDPERLGSTVDKVVRGSACPTLLVGAHASVPLQIERITVPLDGSALAAETLPVARTLAERLGAPIRLVRAVQPPSVDVEVIGSFAADLIESGELTASLYLAEAKLEMETSVPVETSVLSGPPAEALLTDIKENPPSLVVMTSHGHTGFIRWALGSVTERMLRGPVPVLVLRPSHETGDRLKPLTERGNAHTGLTS